MTLPGIGINQIDIGPMCLIAFSPSKFEELSLSFWEQACVANQHGLGVMYHDGQQLVTSTTVEYDARLILALIERIPAGICAALHLREATRGAKCVRNAHPHALRLDGDPGLQLLVMHNGSLPSLPADLQEGPSDTAMLVSTWLAPKLLASPARWQSPEFLSKMEAFAGPRNRFVMVDGQGVWRVVGEHEGFVRGQTWLSNTRALAWLPG
jgi:hypothetical protein